MKNFALILFLLNICFVLPASSARNDAGKDQGDIYIPHNTVAAMQQKEDLSRATAQKAHYYSQKHGKTSKYSSRHKQSKDSSTASPLQKKFRQAPIDQILAKQHYPRPVIEQYKNDITRAYTVLPGDIKVILQNELTAINAENERMQQIRQHWNTQSAVYKFINYQLNTQIATEITSSRKHFQRREKIFKDFFAKAPANKPIYILESTNPLFWLYNTNPQIAQYSFKQNIHYISVFDHDYNHLFTYHRMHINANRNRRILAVQTGDAYIDNKFQRLFDDYGKDLGRISLGLDITNQNLLNQIETMQNDYISETY